MSVDKYSKFLNKVMKKRNCNKVNISKLNIEQTVFDLKKSNYKNESHQLHNIPQSDITITNSIQHFASDNKNRKILQPKRKSFTNVTYKTTQNEISDLKHRHSFGCTSFVESKSTNKKSSERMIDLSKNCKLQMSKNVQKHTKNLAAKRMVELRKSLEVQRKVNEKNDCDKNKSLDVTDNNMNEFLHKEQDFKRSFNEVVKEKKYDRMLKTVHSNKKNLKRKSFEPVFDIIENSSNKSLVDNFEKKLVDQSICYSALKTPSTNLKKCKISNIESQSESSFKNENTSMNKCENKSILSNNYNHSVLLSPNQSLNFELPQMNFVKNNMKDKNLLMENYTVENLKSHVSSNSIDEKMEWEVMPVQQVLEDIQEMRKNIVNTNFSSFVHRKENFSSEQNLKKNILYIIIDTNIFISNINIVKQILDLDLKCRHVIIVPWMVLQELDYMKDNKNNITNKTLQNSAKRAVNFLNNCFTLKHARIKGQTALEASVEVFREIVPDDGILNCCMQYCSNDNFVVLLSDDKNLRNKALVNNINSFGAENILLKLSEELHTTDKNMNTSQKEDKLFSLVQQMQNVLSKYFSTILEYEMKKVYDSLWIEIVFKKPPWTIENILECFIKHWLAVFSLVFPKETKQAIEKLLTVLTNLETQSCDLIVQLSIAICIHLRRINNSYHEIITNCINEIKQLNDT